MLEKHVQPILRWFKQAVTEPRSQLDRTEKTVRFTYELCVHGWRALRRDNAPQMAAALAFRSIFAMLPVVVVSAVLVKAMQGMDQFKKLAQWLIVASGLDTVKVQSSTLVTDSAASTTLSLGEWISQLLDKLININLAALGWVGLAVVIYSAISLMVTIENSMNAIHGAPEGRPWAKRVLVYWAVLTLGPLFIGLTLYIDTQFSGFISRVEAWKWVLTTAKVIWGFCVAWLFMFAVYTQVPNTKVTVRAGLIGAFVAALLLQAGRSLLTAYFGNAVSLGNLYGTLGAVPVFMFWVYLMWLVILFGLEVSATIQRVQGRSLDELEEKRTHSGFVDPASMLDVMEIITERFSRGLATSARHIADETLIHESMVLRMIDRLVEDRILHRVEGRDSGVTLTQPPELISADRLIEIGYSLVDEGGARRQSAFVQRLRDAQRNLARQTTLATLLPPGGPADPSSQVALR